jgi:hypothetical protein
MLAPVANVHADTPPQTPPLEVITGPQPIAPMPNNPLANIPAPITPGMIQASQAASAPAPTGPVAIVGDKVGLVPANIPSNATVIHVNSEKISQSKDHAIKNAAPLGKSKAVQSEAKKDSLKKTTVLGNKISKPVKAK